LHWSNLKDCCFPDAPRPPVDQESPEFKAHLNRYYRELETAPHVVWSVAEEGADEHRKKQVADSNAAIKAELMAEAKKHAVYIMEQMSSAVHELSNLEAFRKSTKSLMEREMRAAGWQHDKKIEDITEAEALAIGKARLRVQRQQIRQLEIFRRRPVLSDTYKAIFNHLDQFLSNPANHKGKRFPSFWRDVRRPAQFSNLTEFGAFVAMMPLEQEAVQENYGVHKEAITALLAALHVYYTHAKLHPNCAMLGDPKAGKSFAGRQTLMFIPGTVSESMGETEKAKFASGQDAEKHFASKIVLMEELPPSMLGLTHLDGKSLANAKKGSAMSDVSSRWRHMATSMKISWDRLVQNQEKGGFDSEHVSYDLHQVIIGALNLPSHLFPENMLSRWLPLEFVQKFRTGMTLINRVLFPTPDQYSAFKEGTQEKMRMQQALLAVACMMMDIGIIQKPSFGSARGFIDEVVELATKRGVTGVADVRHVQRVTALMEVMCVIFAQWSFYSDPKSPAKDTPHSWEHFLMQEKMFSVSIEQAVFVLTLCENQFDNPLASAVLAAIKHTWDVGPAAGQLGFETYSTIQLGDFGDRKSVDQHTSRTFWCNKLYACIQEKMEFKPPKEAAVNYLEQLCDTQVFCSSSCPPIHDFFPPGYCTRRQACGCSAIRLEWPVLRCQRAAPRRPEGPIHAVCPRSPVPQVLPAAALCAGQAGPGGPLDLADVQ
jgi:broad-specificity NMP kinase